MCIGNKSVKFVYFSQPRKSAGYSASPQASPPTHPAIQLSSQWVFDSISLFFHPSAPMFRVRHTFGTRWKSAHTKDVHTHIYVCTPYNLRSGRRSTFLCFCFSIVFKWMPAPPLFLVHWFGEKWEPPAVPMPLSLMKWPMNCSPKD